MKVSRAWLQTFFDSPLPKVSELECILTFGAFEIEGIEAVGEDTVFDVKVLPNRAHDCLCHRGIAKEFSVLCNIPLSHDPLSGSVPSFEKSNALTVTVEKENACPVYQAAYVKGITVGPSPKWLTERLETLGQRSINNVVDATNFVMLELGQPLHSFDAQKLGDVEGSKAIHVRMARAGESIEVLGGTRYELDETIQLITDASGDTPIAIAGIKGGSQAEVDTATKDIILESAKFHPTLTRKASQKLKLRTDASYRFENEIPDELPLYALQALVTLIKDIAGGDVIEYDGFERVRATLPYKIGVSSDEVNKLLGTTLSDNELVKILDRFGFTYTKIENPRDVIVQKAQGVTGAPYKRMARIRFDTPEAFNCATLTAWCAIEAGYTFGIPRITIDQFVYLDSIDEKDLLPGDFIFTNTEEVRTIDGENYSSILGVMVKDEAIRTKTLEYLPGTEVGHGVDHVGIYAGNGEVIHAGSAVGGVVREKLSESKTFAKEKWYKRVVTDTSPRFSVTIPFERVDIRLPSDLFEEVGRVYGYEHIPAQQLPLASVSKTDKVFYYTNKVRDILVSVGFSEVMTYTFQEKGEVKLANSLAGDKGFLRNSLETGLGDAFAYNSNMLSLLGIYDFSKLKFFEIGTVFTKDGEHIELEIMSGAKGNIADTFKHIGDVFGKPANFTFVTGEDGGLMNLTEYVENLSEPTEYNLAEMVIPSMQYVASSIYPFVLRDIAVWVPDEFTGSDVEKIIRENAGEYLVRLDLFDDSYKKDGRTSYAYHLVFQSHEKTLSDDEVNVIMQAVTDELNGRDGWKVR
ncbi:MAG: phenylalanine--tRNA ligase beta subunit-related protein [Candidatus Campbellbacteria bacterium]|nr:phenylalanine--tRNA ligase beta subunit-related protein [Candidatus Campbellbacteria bacterium]